MVTIPSATQNTTNATTEKQKTIERFAKASWRGNLKDGSGTLTTESGVLNKTDYSFKSRFGSNNNAANPEELLAAAHAGCFTMSVAAILSKRGLVPLLLDTLATVTMEGLAITNIHLKITGEVDGIDASSFIAIAKEAEENCVISKALCIPINSEAHFII